MDWQGGANGGPMIDCHLFDEEAGDRGYLTLAPRLPAAIMPSIAPAAAAWSGVRDMPVSVENNSCSGSTSEAD